MIRVNFEIKFNHEITIKGDYIRKKWLEISNMSYKNEKLSWLLQGLDHAWMLYLMMIVGWGGRLAVFREDGGG